MVRCRKEPLFKLPDTPLSDGQWLPSVLAWFCLLSFGNARQPCVPTNSCRDAFAGHASRSHRSPTQADHDSAKALGRCCRPLKWRHPQILENRFGPDPHSPIVVAAGALKFSQYRKPRVTWCDGVTCGLKVLKEA